MITLISYDARNNEILVTFDDNPAFMEIETTPTGPMPVWTVIYNDVAVSSFPNPLGDGEYKARGRTKHDSAGPFDPWSAEYPITIAPDSGETPPDEIEG
jgi:hypothetical protein